MNPARQLFWRKVVYLVAIAVLVFLLYPLSHPATRDARGGKGRPGGVLAQFRRAHGLSQTELGQIDPTSETIKLATLGMRGIAANVLWTKANRYKREKDWTNLSATVNQIVKLQPNFTSIWIFQAWNLSFNVSVEFDDYRDRYHWVIRGIEFIEEGIQYNDRRPRLQMETGWIVTQKIGRSDERKQFRRLFLEDDDFHGSRPVAERDCWLVGKQWYRKAEELVDVRGAKLRGKSPVLFRSRAPMCQMNYAEALETEGTFGEVARLAWKQAAAEWRQYGSFGMPTTDGFVIRLNEMQLHEKNAAALSAQIDAFEPKLREKIVQERRDKLTDQQRAAVDTPLEKRTGQQHTLAVAVEKLTQVTDKDVARRIAGPKRRQAMKLAEQAAESRRMADAVRYYRGLVNFEFWELRARMEQTDEAVAAREFIYRGGQARADGRLTDARDAYQQGLAAWRKVLDRFPELITDTVTGDDLMEVIKRYRRVLDLLDEPFPEDFVLQDIIDLHAGKR